MKATSEMSEIAAEVVGSNQPGGVEQPDAVKSFSFEGLHEKAMAFGEESTQAETPEQAAQPDATQTQEPVQQEDTTKVADASAGQLAQLKDTDLVEVTVDGKPVTMPWGEAKGGVMRQAKFTKEMQQLRADQSTFESQRAEIDRLRQEHEAMYRLVSNKDYMKSFIAKQYPDLVAQAKEAVAQERATEGQIDPNEIATVGQLQEYQKQLESKVQEFVSQLSEAVSQREATIADNIERKQATLKLATEINGTINSIFTENPTLLKVIPNAEQMLRYEVSKLQPKTPEEAVQAFKDVAKGWLEQLSDATADVSKTKVLAKEKLRQNNIQPNKGADVQPTPTNFKKVNKMTGKEDLDWSKIHEAAVAYTK